jgi:hypothetical protein
MSTKAKRHTHKYHKITMSSQMVWACALPDCNHYMPKHMEMMVPGKNTICWGCGADMVLDAHNMTDHKPTCNKCKGLTTDELTTFLAEQGVK